MFLEILQNNDLKLNLSFILHNVQTKYSKFFFIWQSDNTFVAFPLFLDIFWAMKTHHNSIVKAVILILFYIFCNSCLL